LLSDRMVAQPPQPGSGPACANTLPDAWMTRSAVPPVHVAPSTTDGHVETTDCVPGGSVK